MSQKPTTSQNADAAANNELDYLESDEEEMETEEDKTETTPGSKRKSTLEMRELENSLKRQRGYDEINSHRQTLRTNPTRPLFFKLKERPAQVVARQIIRRFAKLPASLPAWAVLEFYQSQTLVASVQLVEPDQTITARDLFVSEDLSDEVISTYAEWDQILGDGFKIQKELGEQTVISMEKKNHSSKYLVFNGNHQLFIANNQKQLIYDGNQVIGSMSGQLTDIKTAHHFVKENCCVRVVLVDSFMNSMPLSLIYTMARDMTTTMPYWFMIKPMLELQSVDKWLLKNVRVI